MNAKEMTNRLISLIRVYKDESAEIKVRGKEVETIVENRDGEGKRIFEILIRMPRQRQK